MATLYYGERRLKGLVGSLCRKELSRTGEETIKFNGDTACRASRPDPPRDKGGLLYIVAGRSCPCLVDTRVLDQIALRRWV